MGGGCGARTERACEGGGGGEGCEGGEGVGAVGAVRAGGGGWRGVVVLGQGAVGGGCGARAVSVRRWGR